MIEKEGDCWVWTGYITPLGYGRIWTNEGAKQAHRVSFQIFVGDISDGKEIDHLCRNRACVNPAHLEQVDHRTNVLRGEGVAAKFARRELCERGHLLVRRRSDSGRRCLECK